MISYTKWSLNDLLIGARCRLENWASGSLAVSEVEAQWAEPMHFKCELVVILFVCFYQTLGLLSDNWNGIKKW